MSTDATRGVGWTTTSTVAQRFVQTVTFVVLARLLEPRDFGLVALATVFLMLVAGMVEQGFGIPIIQRRNLEKAHLDTAFWSGVAVSLVVAALFSALATPISALVGEPSLERVLQLLSLTFVTGALGTVPEALLRRELAFRKLAVRSLVATVVSCVAGITMAIKGYGVWSLVGQTLVYELFDTVLLWASVSWRPGLEVSWARFREMAGLTFSAVANVLITFASRRTDDFLVGTVLGPTELGIYTVAYRLAVLLEEIFIRTIHAVALPIFSRIQDDEPRLIRAFCRASQACAAIAVPVFAGLSLLAPAIVRACFGAHWDGAAPAMRILALASIFTACSYLITTLAWARAKPSVALKIALVHAAGNVVGFAVAVHWGINAVAAAFTIRAYVLAPVTFRMMREIAPISIRRYLSLFVPVLQATVVMGLVVLPLHGIAMTAPGLAIVVAIGAMTYLVALHVIAPALSRDLWSRAGSVISGMFARLSRPRAAATTP